MHDGGVEAALACLLQHHAVQHLAGCRAQSERDVREAHGGVGARDLLLYALDGLERVQAVATHVDGAGAEREGERVEDQVAGGQPVLLYCDLRQPVCDLHLPLHVTGLAAFVDEKTDDRRAVVTRKTEHAVEACARSFAVLEVGGVQDAAPAGELQARLHHLGLGGVENQRHTGLRGEPRCDLVHVERAVTPHVVHAHVEHVRPLADLVGGHLQARVPVGAQHGLAERLRAHGVRALADDEERVLLLDGDGGVERRDARFGDGRALLRCDAADCLHNGAQMLRRGAAAPADDADAEVGHVMTVELGQLLGREVVVGLAIHHARQARVRQHADGDLGVLAEVTQVFLHLGRPGGAVDADGIGLHGHECRVRSADLGPHQHATRGLHGDLHLDGDVPTGGLHCATAGLHRCLYLQQVHARLDEEQVAATVDQSARLLLVGIAQFGEGDVAERGQLGARPDGTRHVAGSSVLRLVLVRHAACDGGGGHVQFVCLLGDVVLGENGGETAEAGGLDGIHAGIQEGAVHRLDHVGTCEGEHLVAALERRSAEVVRTQVESLHERAERPVENDDPFADCFCVRLACHDPTTLLGQPIFRGVPPCRGRVPIV